MKFNIASLALIAALLAICLCQIQAKDGDKATAPDTYFGVDANDAEAVRAKQREMSEEKFKELFGHEAHEEFSRNGFEDAQKQEEKAWSLSDSLKKVVDLFKQGKEIVKNKLEAQKQGDNKEDKKD